MRGPRACVSPRRVRAGQQGAASVRERAEPGEAPRGRAGRGKEGCAPGTFCPPWKSERSRPQGLPVAAGRPERSACARCRPSPTSASRLFLVPGSQGPFVPRETRRRSPTPASAARSHAPAAVSPERTD